MLANDFDELIILTAVDKGYDSINIKIRTKVFLLLLSSMLLLLYNIKSSKTLTISNNTDYLNLYFIFALMLTTNNILYELNLSIEITVCSTNPHFRFEETTIK